MTMTKMSMAVTYFVIVFLLQLELTVHFAGFVQNLNTDYDDDESSDDMDNDDDYYDDESDLHISWLGQFSQPCRFSRKVNTIPDKNGTKIEWKKNYK